MCGSSDLMSARYSLTAGWEVSMGNSSIIGAGYAGFGGRGLEDVSGVVMVVSRVGGGHFDSELATKRGGG